MTLRPERLDRVEIQTAGRVVTITWAERGGALLARLGSVSPGDTRRGSRKPPEVPEAQREIVAAFTAVGVSRR